jgi:4-aminobutyrate aminotransferase-like enzyme
MWDHEVSFVSACNPYRDRGGRSDEEYVKDKVDELRRAFQEIEQEAGPNQVAAFLAEPVVGAVSV